MGGKGVGVSWDSEELDEPPSDPPEGASGPRAGQTLQEHPAVAMGISLELPQFGGPHES